MGPPGADQQADHAFLTGGGDLARRIAAYDWANTSLGPLSGWVPSLRLTTGLMLRSPVPIVLLWGADGVMIYNDAFAIFAGANDSRLLGSNVRDGRGEIANFDDDVIKTCLAGGTLSYSNKQLSLHRHGYPEQVWTNLDYSPVLDERGVPAGVMAIVVETTEEQRVRTALEASEAQFRFLDTLGRAVAGHKEAEHILAVVTHLTAGHLLLSNCAYADMDSDQDGFAVRGDWHAPGSPSITGHYRLADFGSLAVQELRAGRPLIIDDVGELPTPAARAFRDIGISSTICMPLIKEGRLTVMMAAHDRMPRRWNDYDLTVLREVTERCWAHIERVSAEQALARRETQLRRSQEAGGVGLFSLDLDSNILSVTPQFCRIFGLDRCDHVTALEVEGLIVPADVDIISNSKIRRAGTAQLDVEYRIRRADTGEERVIARKGEYEYDPAGRPVRLVGAVQDMTERRRTQLALQKSEAGFSALAQHMPNQVWTARADGFLDWFNAQVYAYCGAASGSLDGDAWSRIVHEDDVGTAAERWTMAIASGDIYETEFRLRSAEGDYRWFLARALPLKDDTGVVTSWMGTNTDIHDQKLIEAASTRDRNRLWTISQDVLLICDYAGQITAINPFGQRSLGWSDAEMVGRMLSDFIHPDDVERTAAEVAKLSTSASTLKFENRYRRKDGEYRLFDWTAVPDGGRIHGVGRDITEQRATEEALRQSQKMEAVGQLTGGIAHDFNNLLQGITGSLDLIRSRLAQGRTNDMERFLHGAISSASRAAALTHRLLAFSRRQPLDPKPVRANPLLASMEDMLRRTLGERIALELVTAGGLWLTRCDPNQLESAILNLVINARDAMPEGGNLTVETCNAHLDAAYAALQHDLKPGQYICICVTDTGIGMSKDTIARAFEPFYTTKPIGQGTGLGLSMIYGFVRQSEGYVRIYSEVDQGTTIKLYLPRYRGQESPEDPLPPQADAPPSEAGEVVLVVEDEPVVRGLIVEVLGDLGYRAIEASDGPKGLEILQSDRRIDLLITDIGLPGLNGRQVVDGGRVSRPDLKVLFMTGYAENAALASGFLEPGMAMITKPFAMEALANRIRDIIED